MTDRVNAALEEALAAAGFEISFTTYKVDLIPDGKIAPDKAGLENKERVMHIGCFTNTYLPTINGVVRSVNSFRQGLTELGHNVFILAPRARRYKDTMPFVFRYPSLKIGLGYDLKLVMPVSRFANQLLPALKLDIIHSHHPFLLGEIAAKKAAKLDLPLVFTFHTRYREYSHYAGIGQGIAEAVAHRRLSDYLKKCDQVIVPSNSIKQMLDRDYGTNQRVTVVPTGIDLGP